MIHTRHAALVALMLVCGALASASVYLKSHDPMKTDVANGVLFGIPPETYTATLVTHKKNSDVRESLIAKLGVGGRSDEVEQPTTEPDVVVQELPVVEEVSLEREVSPHPKEGALFVCGISDPESLAPGNLSAMSDQILPTIVSEGARVITLNAVSPQQVQFLESPMSLPSPQCVTLGIVGILRDGAPLSAGARISAPESVLYGESVHLGYARDGFSIRSTREDGVMVTNDDLDACHGHTHQVMTESVVMNIYHYHYTDEFPYTVGCYGGAPVPLSP